MIKATLVWGLIATAGFITASAEDFPLRFRTIPAQDVLDFPGGYGGLAELRFVRPAKLRSEPKAISRHPLYGETRETAGGISFLVRVDESQGDGKGYDQLIVDMNQNGDLTDDAPAPRVALPAPLKPSASASRRVMFGPIQAPADKMIAGGRPIYFAQGYINQLSSTWRLGERAQNISAGYVRLKAGWYAEATVELKGVKEKVGVLDGDCNLRLGDVSEPRTYGGLGEEQSWYFPSADALLIDVNGSGAFEGDAFGSEECSFGPVVYLGATPYRVALTSDLKALRVEPWDQPLAEVSLQPNGAQVCSVTLAWEQPNKQWQLLSAGVAGGKIKIPPGNYRLYACQLIGKGSSRDEVMVSAFERIPKTPTKFAADKANTLRCGAPLEIKVTAQKRLPRSYELNSGDLRNPPLSTDSEYVLSINGNVRGAGGEVYSAFAKGPKFKEDPPRPTFTVTDASGRKVSSGNLEFG
jgi:hypothetical protein